METNNVVLLRGTLSSDPVVRELPSGDLVTQVELTTRVDGRAISVPVAVHRTPVTLGAGDVVVVTGHVHRRFFRTGGVTQSRTEVIAHEFVKATRARTVERLIDGLLRAVSAGQTSRRRSNSEGIRLDM